MSDLAVSVVVATHDRPMRLAALLRSLARQTLPRERFEVIVVDDASPGGATQRALAAEPSVRIVRRRESNGPAGARNAGWRVARAPRIAFTDDDCEADPRWLEALLRESGDDRLTVVQGRTDPLPSELGDLGPFTRTLEVHRLGPHFQTCNIAYPRELLERLGGFDERYPFPGGEDTDLAWRAIEHGAAMRFAADAQVFHAVSDLGPLGRLRHASRWTETVRIYARHPAYRRVATRRIFWKGSHGALAYAAVGLVAAQRFSPAILLVVPYVLHVGHECRGPGRTLALAPYVLVHDLVETYAVLRGAVRFRVLIV